MELILRSKVTKMGHYYLKSNIFPGLCTGLESKLLLAIKYLQDLVATITRSELIWRRRQ